MGDAIAIIDYGIGNLRSVEKAFAATGIQAVITADEKRVRQAAKLVLPGVGAFAKCMEELTLRGFDKVVRDCATDGTPILGVCVGMQLLFEESEEFGHAKGLGLLQGVVRRFGEELLVPQVGWNQIKQTRDHILFNDVDDGSFCYFVHSYFCAPSDSDCVIGETEYGGSYASVVAAGNVCGVQFHPEKSQKVGLQMLNNFANMSN